MNLSASPYYRDKREMRRAMLAAIARRHRIPVAMVNQVGGNDSLIFDGSSLVLDEQGEHRPGKVFSGRSCDRRSFVSAARNPAIETG